VEVKVGVQHSPRELAVESPLSAEELESLVSTALSSKDGVLTLEDERGRKLVVQVSKVAYIEIGEPETRRVGFGAL
jgi:pyruvate/2-oxoglutarate/acetoin dehydrogenase E1 component